MPEHVLRQLQVHGGAVGDAAALSLRGVVAVLRGRGGTCDIPPLMLHQPVHQKQGIGPEHGIGLPAQKIPVPAVLIVMVEFLGQPRQPHGPHGPGDTAFLPSFAPVSHAHGSGGIPGIRIVVLDAAPAAVVHGSRMLPVLRQLLHIGEIGLHALLQPTAHGRPVVHLQVDIGGPVAAPGSLPLPAPDALEIGGKAALAGGGNHQIAPVLEIQAEEPIVLPACPQVLQAHIRGLLQLLPQVQLHAVEDFSVVVHMGFPDGLIIALQRGGPHRFYGEHRPGAAPDPEPPIFYGYLPVSLQHPDFTGKPFPSVSPDDSFLPFPDIAGIQMLRASPPEIQALRPFLHPAFQQGTQGHHQIHHRLRCPQGHQNGLSRIGDEHLPAVVDSLRVKVHIRHRLLQIQAAAVVLHSAAIEGFTVLQIFVYDIQIPQREIGFAVLSQHLPADQLLRLRASPLEYQPADLLQTLRGLRIGPVPLVAAPEAVLVQAQHLLPGHAPDHGSQPAVSKADRLLPSPRGLLIVQFQFLVHRHAPPVPGTRQLPCPACRFPCPGFTTLIRACPPPTCPYSPPAHSGTNS